MADVKDIERSAQRDGHPVQVALHVYLGPEDGAWVAINSTHTIVGQGASPDEAVNRMVELTQSYLEVRAREGVAPQDAVRPIPRRWRLKLEAQVAAARLGQKIRHKPASRSERELTVASNVCVA